MQATQDYQIMSAEKIQAGDKDKQWVKEEFGYSFDQWMMVMSQREQRKRIDIYLAGNDGDAIAKHPEPFIRVPMSPEFSVEERDFRLWVQDAINDQLHENFI